MNCEWGASNRCVRCGRVKPKAGGNVYATCRASSKVSDEDAKVMAYLSCQYRSQIEHFITAKDIGCGCASERISVYKCGHFNESVLIHASPRQTDALRKKILGYNGRTCRTCDYVRG